MFLLDDYKQLYFDAISDIKELLHAQKKIINENKDEVMSKMYAIAIYDGISICYGVITGEEPELYKEEENE